MPTVRVDLLDSKITVGQKRQLAESLSDVVSETLGYPKDRVLIIFHRISKSDMPAAENWDANSPYRLSDFGYRSKGWAQLEKKGNEKRETET